MCSGRWPGHAAGQFAFVTLHADEGAHPYTHLVGLGRRRSHQPSSSRRWATTRHLAERVKVGDHVNLEGPYGRSTFEGTQRRQIWVGGGIGITPFIARMQALARQPNGSRSTCSTPRRSTTRMPSACSSAMRASADVRLHLLWDERDGRLERRTHCRGRARVARGRCVVLRPGRFRPSAEGRARCARPAEGPLPPGDLRDALTPVGTRRRRIPTEITGDRRKTVTAPIRATCHRRFRRSAGLLTAILLAGCAAVGPDYAAPEPATPATWRGAAAAKVAVMPTAPADLANWWRQLDDPTLTGLIEQALQTSLDLRTAQAKLREARARRALAGAELFPTVSGSAAGRRVKASGESGGGGTANRFSAGFDASWELDIFGGLRRSVEAAQADLEASEASLHDVPGVAGHQGRDQLRGTARFPGGAGHRQGQRRFRRKPCN